MHNAVEQRHPQDAQVEPGGPMGDVVKVVLDPFAERSVAAPAVDLGPTRDSGFDAVPGHVVGDRLGEFLDEDRPFGTRADQAHVAHQDVEELRQLVQASAAEKGPETGAARVVFLSPDGPGLLLGIDAHAAELEHAECLAV